jgi:hypothetical protein
MNANSEFAQMVAKHSQNCALAYAAKCDFVGQQMNSSEQALSLNQFEELNISVLACSLDASMNCKLICPAPA